MTSRPTNTDAALVGMGVRLPGPDGQDVRGPRQMWQTLMAGKTAIGRYPQARWEAMLPLLHPDDRQDLPWPAALITWPEQTQARLWGLRSSDTEHLSPTQVLVLQVVAEALADAGIDPATLAGPGTHIYVAYSSPDDALHTFTPGARPTLPELSAGGAGMVGSAVSRWLDSRGALCTFDASCAASMYALHAARRDLAEGTATTAIVIGVNTLTHPVPTRAFLSGGVLAQGGNVRPLDRDADGYARGEAVMAAVLRPYEKARKNQDRVYALLDHTVVGSDGRSAAVGAPSAHALAELMGRAHTESGVGLDQVPLVLVHGPGTKAGARCEARALHAAYARTPSNPMLVSSVKGMFGHSEAAAGLTNLLTAALITQAHTVPPTAGHTQAPDWLEGHGVRVAHTDDRLPPGGVSHHLGVIAQGFSGAIGYALVRPTPHEPRPRTGNDPRLGGAAVLPLAAVDQGGLRAAAAALAPALDRHPKPRLARVGDHLTRRRPHSGPVRSAVVATGPVSDAPWRALAQGEHHPDVVTMAPEGGPWRPVWAFGGHGAAHPHMAVMLYQRDRVFAAHLDRVLAALEPHTPAEERWRPGQPVLGLAQTQRATWAVQVAMAHTLTERWGLRPDTVVGHSLGEVAAAHVAGALSLADAARLVCVRADLLERLTEVGAMVTARVDAATAAQLTDLHPVDVACINSPEQVVFSGTEAALDDLVLDLLDREAEPRALVGSPPAHSRHVDTVLDELASALRGLRPTSTNQGCEFVSTVTASTTPGPDLDAPYWVAQLRAPVRWEETMALLGRRGPALVTELSPKPVLATPTAHIRARHGLDLEILAAGTPGDERRGLALAAAHAYVCHLPVRWPYPARAPLEHDPVLWQAPQVERASWPEQVAALRGPERRRELVAVVLAAVAGLAPVRVSASEHLNTDLADLGLHSFDRLVLGQRLLDPLDPRPPELPEHQPTIASIAAALDGLLPGQGPSS
ncbi:acyltransferase domain-containing protein [Nocardiopsis terrae]|uniref:acyltransferase domain-containing protein n=1 Tax=Streptomyces sp. NPDC057554 TaxID=3350538 RepID=UPI0036D0F53A